MKENVFTLKQARSRWDLAKTITDADYGDALVLLANTPPQVESLLDSQEHAVRDIGPDMNPDKTEFTYSNLGNAIFSLNGELLKSVEKFIYIGSNILATENDVIIHKGKAWTAIDRLMEIWFLR